MMKQTRIISLIITAVLLCVCFFAPGASAFCGKEEQTNSLYKAENEIRYSTSLSGEAAEYIEIVGVTVLTHTKSGNVAFEYSDSNSTNVEIGALLNIYIKNKTNDDIYPLVKFNGKTACEYLNVYPQQISWANTPDTRSDRSFDIGGPYSDELSGFTPLTTYIPSGALDCYSINVTDGNLLYNGLTAEFTVNGKTGTAVLYGDEQTVNIKRIQWQSSSGNAYYPDGFDFFIESQSSYETVINYIKLYDGTPSYELHYWTERENLDFTGGNTISANEPLFGGVQFDEPLAFEEYLVEFNITNNGRTYSIFEKTRPLVHSFDISVGWASGDLARDSYIKAISSMHFNTVIGALDSNYYLKSDEFRQQYPIKIFGYNEGAKVGGEMLIDNGTVTVYACDDIHAALPFGEPQLSDGEGKQQPMRVMNKLFQYRNAPYSTNITLSHEPAFYRFAGLSDMCHYDAYRVISPFSDAWYHYYKYASSGKYGIYWGAPLETQGDYMRTLAQLNYPNPVAAWTQGTNTWNTFPRFTTEDKYMFSPNPYELRIQAYENVANGANSLYWFTINGDDLLYYTESAPVMLYVNRELRTVGDLLAGQIPYSYSRTDNFDLNLNVTPDNTAVLFVTDINYSIKNEMYEYHGSRGEKSFSFDIPSYLSDNTELVKITKDGVTAIDGFTVSDGKISFSDSVDMTGMYVFGASGTYDSLCESYACVVSKETYNIYENSSFYNELQSDFGYSEDNPFVPEAAEKANTTGMRILYTILGIIIRPLEKIVSFFVQAL